MLFGWVLGTDVAQWIVVGLAVWMLLWWVSEAAPLAVTALLPLIVLPVTGVLSIDQVSSAYASPVVFLFFGGFLLAAAAASCGLHRRVAAATLRWAGDARGHQVAAIVFTAGFLSMWIPNTATVALMLPIVLAIVAGLDTGDVGTRSENDADRAAGVRREAPEGDEGLGSAAFAGLLLLGVVAAANIGGMATLIGTPPNAVLAGYLSREWGYDVGFLRWMLYALPVSLALLGLTWLWIMWRLRSLERGRSTGVQPAPAAATPYASALPAPAWSKAERRVALVFAGTVLAWILRPQLNAWGLDGLNDAQIALAAAVLLFVLPAGRSHERLLGWDETQRLPWGVLLLIGGGIALGSAIEQVELASAWMRADWMALERSPLLWIGALCLLAMALSHFVSNTAAAALLLPTIAAAAGSGVDASAFLMFALPVVLAASCAFLLPTATPPNAIVFASGRVTVAEMVRSGWPLSMAALLAIGGLALALYAARLNVLV